MESQWPWCEAPGDGRCAALAFARRGRPRPVCQPELARPPPARASSGAPGFRRLQVAPRGLLPPGLVLVAPPEELHGGALLLGAEPHRLHHLVLGLAEREPGLALRDAGQDARVQPQHHLPGRGVLAEDGAAVVHQEGRHADALAVLAVAQVEHGLEEGQEVVVQVLGREAQQAQVATQGVELQVEEHQALVADEPLRVGPHGGELGAGGVDADEDVLRGLLLGLQLAQALAGEERAQAALPEQVLPPVAALAEAAQRDAVLELQGGLELFLRPPLLHGVRQQDARAQALLVAQEAPQGDGVHHVGVDVVVRPALVRVQGGAQRGELHLHALQPVGHAGQHAGPHVP
mmetsp:Transcript_4752/g.13319  ORF Transcript_4752/g.13319 Transcript_4752/m.13319 type:complete len:347 (+) Transcript_4752:84-1124(+)